MNLLRSCAWYQFGNVIPDFGIGWVKICRIHERSQHQIQCYSPGSRPVARISHLVLFFVAELCPSGSSPWGLGVARYYFQLSSTHAHELLHVRTLVEEGVAKCKHFSK